MADLNDIARGLAALLRAVLPEDEGHVSPFFETVPPTPCLQVAGVDEAVRITGGDGMQYTFAVEAVLSTVSPRESQSRLLGWIDQVALALEADSNGAGALYSRLQDDNTLLADQDAAADDVAFARYLGQGRARPAGSSEELIVGTWQVTVIA